MCHHLIYILLLQPIYPTIVIVLVETQRSMADVWEISPSNASKFAGPVATEVRPATFGHLSFAVGTAHTSTDIEVELSRSRTLHSRSGQEHGLEEVVLEGKDI